MKSEDLKPLLPLIRKHRDRLYIISERKPRWSVPGTNWLSFSYSRWRYEVFPGQITNTDLGISYRDVGGPYNQAHISFKIAVFLAMGVPVLASPVPSYTDLLGTGQGGKICHSMAEYSGGSSL